MSTKTNQKTSGRPSLHPVDVRTGRTKGSRKKTWWVVEWRPNGQEKWTEAGRSTIRKNSETQISRIMDIHGQVAFGPKPTLARLVEVEAVERRVSVGEPATSSHIGALTGEGSVTL